MKKHKFKVGDVVYCISAKPFGGHAILCGKPLEDRGGYLTIKNRHGSWLEPVANCHPTPEACAQALVEEFYINNPKKIMKCLSCDKEVTPFEAEEMAKQIIIYGAAVCGPECSGIKSIHEFYINNPK